MLEIYSCTFTNDHDYCKVRYRYALPCTPSTSDLLQNDNCGNSGISLKLHVKDHIHHCITADPSRPAWTVMNATFVWKNTILDFSRQYQKYFSAFLVTHHNNLNDSWIWTCLGWTEIKKFASLTNVKSCTRSIQSTDTMTSDNSSLSHLHL
jgi:hypothetical protein